MRMPTLTWNALFHGTTTVSKPTGQQWHKIDQFVIDRFLLCTIKKVRMPRSHAATPNIKLPRS